MITNDSDDGAVSWNQKEFALPTDLQFLFQGDRGRADADVRAHEDERFAKLVNTYTGYRGDEPLKEIVLKIYRFMQSAPFPKEWLAEKVRMFESNEEKDFFSNSSFNFNNNKLYIVKKFL